LLLTVLLLLLLLLLRTQGSLLGRRLCLLLAGFG